MRNELVKKIIRRAVKCVCFALIFLLLLQLCSMVLVPRNDKAEDSTLNTVVFGYLGWMSLWSATAISIMEYRRLQCIVNMALQALPAASRARIL